MKNNAVLLSIIAVNHNSGSNLYKTILSIYDNAKDINFEVIVIDNLSTDDSLLKVVNLGLPGIKIISENDFGIYDAMNKGILMAQGEWAWFLNSGDNCIVEIGEIVNFLSSVDGRYNLIFSDAIVGANERLVQKFNLYFLLRGMINHQSMLYRRDIFPKFNPKYGLCADFADLLVSYKKIRHLKFNIPLVKYDLNGKSSALHRSKRISIWYDRLLAFKDGDLPLGYKGFAILFCLFVIFVKIIKPDAFSKIAKFQL